MYMYKLGTKYGVVQLTSYFYDKTLPEMSRRFTPS